MQFAAQGGNLEIVNLLLERELYDVNHVNSGGQNALYYAVLSLNKEVVERFIKLGLNPTLVGNDGTTIKDFLANEINSQKDPVKLAQANEIKRMIDVYTEKYLAVRGSLLNKLDHLPSEFSGPIVSDALRATSLNWSEENGVSTIKIERMKDAATSFLIQYPPIEVPIINER